MGCNKRIAFVARFSEAIQKTCNVYLVKPVKISAVISLASTVSISSSLARCILSFLVVLLNVVHICCKLRRHPVSSADDAQLKTAIESSPESVVLRFLLRHHLTAKPDQDEVSVTGMHTQIGKFYKIRGISGTNVCIKVRVLSREKNLNRIGYLTYVELVARHGTR